MNVIKKLLTNILIYGTEFIVIMLSVFPIVWVALSSFKTNAQILEGPFTLPTGITTAKEAYMYLFQKYDFFSYFGNSLMISLISTVISLVCFAMAAYVLAKYEFPGRNLIFALFTITMLVPGHAKAQPIFSLINSMHLYDTKTGLILVYLGSGIAMSIFILKSAFMGVPKELDEAATIDGAGFFRTYFYAALLTSSEKNRTLPVALQFFNQSLSYDYTKMFAALTLVVVPAIIVYCFAQEQVQESVAASGIKG